MKRIVLSLCDYTGNFVEPWRKAGYECWTVDLQHGGTFKVDGMMRVNADVRSWLPPRAEYAFCAAFPPCTDIAVSGARWFKEKGLGSLAEAIEVFAACVRICEWTGAPWFCENPVSVIASHYRKPDYIFNPCDYAGYLDQPELEAYTKKTCLWTGGGFVMPEQKAVVPVLGSKMHLLPPSPERANLRSETPKGFAKAIFEVNRLVAEKATA